MSGWVEVFLLTLTAGLAMPAGALIASVEHIKNGWLENEFRHSVIAFGGGILISAVSLVLLPEGMKNLAPAYVVLCFGLGGLAFMGIDVMLSAMNTKASQMIAMLGDFVPEVIALGALYLLDRPYAILLACLIAFQNLPEGFNAYLELREGDRYKGRTIIKIFLITAFIGPIAGLLGYYFVSEYRDVVSGMMLFASGGILYLIFQDIAPQAKIEHRWGPALGAVGGFLLGMIGKVLVTH